MSNIGQIIAIGGGGFGRNPNSTIIEDYILKLSSSDIPKICFIPTASAEDKSYIVNFYKAFSKLDCKPTHLNLFERTPNLRSIINKQDVIYIGGGNTKSMLAVWKDWKLDVLLKKAHLKGKVFRIGHLGFVSDRDVLTAIAAIEATMQSLNLLTNEMGAGTAAASAELM